VNSNNNVSRIKRDILARTARLALEGRLAEAVDRLPYEMTGPGWEPVRCCVHHDRAILRLRLMAILGADPAELDDADRPLADYARAAEARAGKPKAEREKHPVLTVIDEACNACVKTRFLVTEACQGCLARPCKMNCPRHAIDFIKGRSHIDTDKCINCGLCQKNCPYSAIVKLPVPCEEACPVGAISKGEDGVERIDDSKCILCGKCLRECPFGAVSEFSDIVGLAIDIRGHRPLAALVAPAVAVQFPGGWARLKTGLKKLGFDYIEEVAKGAECTARDEAAELAERRAEGAGFLATSCCPSWVSAVHRHLPALESHVSSTPSPLVYTARLAAASFAAQGARPSLVFIGPCVAKRAEARSIPEIDRVITAEELGALFIAADIDLSALEAEPEAAAAGSGTASGAAAAAAAPGGAASALSLPAAKLARGFAGSGGVAAAVLAEKPAAGGCPLPATDSGADPAAAAHAGSAMAPGAAQGAAAPRSLVINGLSKPAIKLMATWAAKPPEADLVEVMACEGGCIGGPCVIATPRLAQIELGKFAAEGRD